jgi:membrane protein YqaA with SNARE-associated domain
MINKKNFLNELRDNIIMCSKSKYALIILIIVAFTESSFFVIPPDVLLFAMAMAVPSRAFFYAFVTMVSSVLGGLFGYLIGYLFFDMFIFEYISSHPKYLAAFNQFKDFYNSYSFMATFIAGFTPIPYKIATIASGAFQANIVYFTLASIASRGLRFFLLAFVIKLFHKSGKELIIKHFKKLIIVLSLLACIIFIIYKIFV